MDLTPLFAGEIGPRLKPIPFRFREGGALVFQDYKCIAPDLKKDRFQLYDLKSDPVESRDLSDELPELAALLEAYFDQWQQSVDASVAGKDYEPRTLSRPDPTPIFWTNDARYQPYFEALAKRPEYERALKPLLEARKP
jgi:hypothetical protein